jgi:signal transduction histidine kinase
METLVSRLLALSRAEHGEQPLQKQSVPVGKILDDLLRPLADRIVEARLTVEREIPDDATVDTDPLLFETIVANLIDNAVTYATPGHPVRIQYGWVGDTFQLRVSNAAHDLVPDDLPRLFERFWRKDRARTGTSHAGLGLALSRSLAETLGFELSASLESDRILVMTLRGSI